MSYKGRAHKVGDHIDTDAIIPAPFLVTTDPMELGRHCMAGLEPDWIKRVAPGDIIVAGENFGCGSSREHAPIAIKGAGIDVVAAKSFARIFYRNAFNMGLILLEIGEAAQAIADGDQLEVDVERGVIRNTTRSDEIVCQPVPPFMRDILDAGGLVGYVRARLQGRGN
jgi:3-isopropylmalate/(R)-2-methylmalate dehydratase small subunit